MAARGKKRIVSQNSTEEHTRIDEDSDVPDDIHQGFIESVKQIHGKLKITPATRHELAAEVSEFNFHPKKKSATGKNQFRENDLLRAIKKKQPKIVNKLENTNVAKTLPKPLETIHEKKAQREVGFGNVKEYLDRWGDIVLNNRVADQMRFPLTSKQIEVYDNATNDIFSSFLTPTPLEMQFHQILNSSHVAKDEAKKMEQSKFRLTLKEMMEKRRMISKAKAQASYQVAKAKRQNKIKSKKYHRILRREKIKQQLKDFEALRKSDPEAAFKQLEQIEKNRALERTTLRHRNTGKWAHNQMVKAKYNTESRIALSEQLSKNRELTEKTRKENSDIESGDSENEGAMQSLNVDLNNPWIAKSNEYAQFVVNYKKFWEESQAQIETTTYGAKIPKNPPIRVPQNSRKIVPEDDPIGQTNVTTESLEKVPVVNKVKSEKKNEKKSATRMIEEKRPTKVMSINTSSGLWSVTEITIGDDPSSDVTNAENNISNIFDSLEEKLQRKLKRKFKEVQKTNDRAKVVTNKKNKKSKKVKVGKYLKNVEKITSNINEVKTAEVDKQSDLTSQNLLSENIDPNKYLKVTTKHLITEMSDIMNGGDEGIDDEEVNGNQQYCMTIGEAFAEDDVIAEFSEEKKKTEEQGMPKIIDTSLPGWGSWTDASTINEEKTRKVKRSRLNKRLLFKLPKAPPRKDSNKGRVIINEEKSDKFKEHMVSELPYHFTQVKDFEANIRAPIGRTWLPETAHQQLIAPAICTKLGTVIEPIDEGELIKRNEI